MELCRVIHDHAGAMLFDNMSDEQKAHEIAILDKITNDNYTTYNSVGGTLSKIYGIEIVPGAHFCSQKKWNGIVVAMHHDEHVSSIWQPDMIGCVATYRIKFPTTHKTGGGGAENLIAVDNDIAIESVKSSAGKTFVDPILTGGSMKHTQAVLDVCSDPQAFRELIKKLELCDFSLFSAKTLATIQDTINTSIENNKILLEYQKQAAETDKTEKLGKLDPNDVIKQVKILYEEISKSLLTNHATVTGRIPFGGRNCSINIGTSSDHNHPTTPTLWLTVRNYDPIMNMIVKQIFARSKDDCRTIGTLVSSHLYLHAESHIMQVCDNIMTKFQEQINTILTKSVDKTTNPQTANGTKSAPLALERFAANHYNVLLPTWKLHKPATQFQDLSPHTYAQDVLFYSGCQRVLSNSGGVALGLGRLHGFVFYMPQDAAHHLDLCAQAFPLGLEGALHDITRLCARNNITQFQKEQLERHKVKRIVWATGPSNKFKWHPKLVCAPTDDETVKHLAARLPAVDLLASSLKHPRKLRLWPVRSYISAPSFEKMSLFELCVHIEDGDVTLNKTQLVEYIHMARTMNARTEGDVGKLSHASLLEEFQDIPYLLKKM